MYYIKNKIIARRRRRKNDKINRPGDTIVSIQRACFVLNAPQQTEQNVFFFFFSVIWWLRVGNKKEEKKSDEYAQEGW